MSFDMATGKSGGGGGQHGCGGQGEIGSAKHVLCSSVQVTRQSECPVSIRGMDYGDAHAFWFTPEHCKTDGAGQSGTAPLSPGHWRFPIKDTCDPVTHARVIVFAPSRPCHRTRAKLFQPAKARVCVVTWLAKTRRVSALATLVGIRARKGNRGAMMDLGVGFAMQAIEVLAVAFIAVLGLLALDRAGDPVRDRPGADRRCDPAQLSCDRPVPAYLFTKLGEFFRQYFFAMDREELPFNRAQRDWVGRAASGQGQYHRLWVHPQYQCAGHADLRE